MSSAGACKERHFQADVLILLRVRENETRRRILLLKVPFFFYYYHIVLFSGVSTGLGRKGGRLKRERCYLTVLCYTMSVVTMFFDGVTVWMRASLFILYWRNLRDRFFIGAAVFFFRR